MWSSVDELRIVSLQAFRDARGVLAPVEFAKDIPFPVVRLFWIADVPAGMTRGEHAHKLCNQFFICLAGRCEIEAFDGQKTRHLRMEVNQGLHVPPGIFSTERFGQDGSILAVLCDRPYEVDDYITSREDLAAVRNRLR